MAKQKLSECLGEYEALGFSLVPEAGALCLYFKETLLHTFVDSEDKPITAGEIQAKCSEYIANLNAKYN
jgi:hypothetical protein